MTFARRIESISAPMLFAGVFLFAMLVAAVFSYPRHWSQGILGPDDAWHAQLSRHVYEGHGYVSSVLYPMDAMSVEVFPVPEPLKQSGLSLLTAAVWKVTGVGLRPVIVIALIAFSLGVGVAAVLARKLLGSNAAGLLIGALIVCNPAMLALNVAPLPTALVFALFMVVMLLLHQPTLARVVAAALATAAFFVVKGYAIVYPPVICVYLYFVCPRRRLHLPLAYLGTLFVALGLASVVLPDNSVTLVKSGSHYALSHLHEWYYPPGIEPFSDLYPADPWPAIFERPLAFAAHYARLASRTKRIIDGISGPALAGWVFPLLGLALGLFALDALLRQKLLPRRGDLDPSHLSRDVLRQALLGASIAATFAFFWAIQNKMMYFVHMYPLMLMLILALGMRLAGVVGPMSVSLRRALVAAVIGYALLYPLAYSVRRAYVDPYFFVGMSLPVRQISLAEMSATLDRFIDPEDVVVTDLAHEIAWLNGNPSIGVPLDEQQLETLVGRFDVRAVYEGPGRSREWGYLREAFDLVDDANGRLWIRR